MPDLLQTPGLAWLLGGAVLAIIELLMPGIFFIFVAAGAAATGVVTLIFPGAPLLIQIALFAAATFAAVMWGRRWYLQNPVPSSDPLLNDRAARLIGQTVLVVQAIESGEGRVRVGDGEWPAHGPDTPQGAHVRIVAAHGTALSVEPAPMPAPGIATPV